MRISDLPRNDLDACKRFYASRGRLTADEYHMLAMLQDDPAGFVKLARAWTVVR